VEEEDRTDDPNLHLSAILFELATGKQRRELQFQVRPSEQEEEVAFNPRGMPLRVLENDLNGVHGLLAFAPRGRILALGLGGTVHLYDTLRGKELRRCGGLSVNARSAVFSPEGKYLAAGTHDGQLCLWEVATGTLLVKTPAGHRSTVTTLAFSTDGKSLFSGSADSTLLCWDVPTLLALQTPDPSTRKLEALWDDLGSEDASRADQAIRELSTRNAAAVAFLQKKLRPVVISVDQKGIERLVTDLDSNEYLVREKAMRELEKLERVAAPSLRRALASKQASLEVRRRLERLLDKLESPVISPNRLQGLRALEVLELLGSPDARHLLESLARGTPSASFTREAQETLERLNR
jgi:hypothetical protein